MNANRIRVPVPAETGVEDRLVGSLTFRHAAYLAAGAAGVAVMVLGDPSVVRIVVGALLALCGFMGAACRPFGEPLDRLVPASVAFAVRRRRERRAAPSSDDQPTATEEPFAAETADLAEMREVPESADASAPDDSGASQRQVRYPALLRRVGVVVAVLAVVGVAVGRLTTRQVPPPPPERQVVVVPIPVPVPEPWEEVDDALDTWIDSVVIG